jgi:hypothetical protein
MAAIEEKPVPWRCRIGLFHCWGRWSDEEQAAFNRRVNGVVVDDNYQACIQRRTCRDCGAIGTRMSGRL